MPAPNLARNALSKTAVHSRRNVLKSDGANTAIEAFGTLARHHYWASTFGRSKKGDLSVRIPIFGPCWTQNKIRRPVAMLGHAEAISRLRVPENARLDAANGRNRDLTRSFTSIGYSLGVRSKRPRPLEMELERSSGR